jgi:hypothetical protein
MGWVTITGGMPNPPEPSTTNFAELLTAVPALFVATTV